MHAKYLLIGSGRVGTHLKRYFDLLGLSSQTWSRSESISSLHDKASAASHVLCLISDPAIEGFIREHEAVFQGKTLVHASGSLVTPLAESAHPLMTFPAGRFYDLQTYRSIPFVTEKGRQSLAELLPGLPNPSYELDSELKPLYHALCVLSGNFTVILWQKAFAEFEARLGLPREVLLPYLAQVAANLAADPLAALTGPLARGDRQTIHTHLRQLEGDPFADVYRAFVAAAAATRPTPAQGKPHEV